MASIRLVERSGIYGFASVDTTDCFLYRIQRSDAQVDFLYIAFREICLLRLFLKPFPSTEGV